MKLGKMRLFTMEVGKYRNGRVAVSVYGDGFPYAVLSVNVPEIELGEGEFVLNHDLNLPIFRRFLIEVQQRWCKDTGRTCDYGFVRNQPIWCLK